MAANFQAALVGSGLKFIKGKKQSNKNKICKCGEDLDQAKRSKRVRYWINYEVKGKQQRLSLARLGLDPYSVEDARDAEAKRRVDHSKSR